MSPPSSWTTPWLSQSPPWSSSKHRKKKTTRPSRFVRLQSYQRPEVTLAVLAGAIALASVTQCLPVSERTSSLLWPQVLASAATAASNRDNTAAKATTTSIVSSSFTTSSSPRSSANYTDNVPFPSHKDSQHRHLPADYDDEDPDDQVAVESASVTPVFVRRYPSPNRVRVQKPIHPPDRRRTGDNSSAERVQVRTATDATTSFSEKISFAPRSVFRTSTEPIFRSRQSQRPSSATATSPVIGRNNFFNQRRVISSTRARFGTTSAPPRRTATSLSAPWFPTTARPTFRGFLPQTGTKISRPFRFPSAGSSTAIIPATTISTTTSTSTTTTTTTSSTTTTTTSSTTTSTITITTSTTTTTISPSTTTTTPFTTTTIRTTTLPTTFSTPTTAPTTSTVVPVVTSKWKKEPVPDDVSLSSRVSVSDSSDLNVDSSANISVSTKTIVVPTTIVQQKPLPPTVLPAWEVKEDHRRPPPVVAVVQEEEERGVQGNEEDYQQDARWDPSHVDSSMYHVSATAAGNTKPEEKEPFVQQKHTRNSEMVVVIKPYKFTRNTMVHVKYELVNSDPLVEGDTAFSDSDGSGSDMSPSDMSERAEAIVLPLKEEDKLYDSSMEVPINNLSQGWYLVCGQSIKEGRILEESCFRARIFNYVDHGADTALHYGIYLAAILAFLVALLVIAYVVNRKIKQGRRKKHDRALRERVERKAQQERELQEKEFAAFKEIYLDPDVPYQERCIM